MLDVQQYVQSDDFKKVLALMDLSAAEPEFKIYTVGEVSGKEAINTMRST